MNDPRDKSENETDEGQEVEQAESSAMELLETGRSVTVHDENAPASDLEAQDTPEKERLSSPVAAPTIEESSRLAAERMLSKASIEEDESDVKISMHEKLEDFSDLVGDSHGSDSVRADSPVQDSAKSIRPIVPLTETLRVQSTPGAFRQGGTSSTNQHNENSTDLDRIDGSAEFTSSAMHRIPQANVLSAELVPETVLATASPVQELPETREKRQQQQTRKQLIIMIGILAVCLLALTIGLSMGLTRRDRDDSADSTDGPPPLPPPRPPLDGNFSKTVSIGAAYGAVWGSLSSECETVQPPPLLVECHPDDVLVLDVTNGADCARQSQSATLCQINDAKEQQGAVLFSCVGNVIESLVPTVTVNATRADSCSAPLNNNTQTNITNVQGGRAASFLLALHFCPSNDSDTLTASNWRVEPLQTCSAGELMRIIDNSTDTESLEYCVNTGACTLNTSLSSSSCSITVDAVSIQDYNNNNACFTRPGEGPTPDEMLEFVLPILEQSDLLAESLFG